MLLDNFAVIFGVIATLLSGAVWVMSLTNKLSSRALNGERDIEDLEKRVAKIEHETSFLSLKETFSRIVFEVFHSKEFKEANEQVVKSTIKDTLLHIERNRSIAQAGSLDLILDKLDKLDKLEKHDK